MPMHKTKRLADGEGFLKGQLLIAMPGMTDRRFVRSVIYMCAHSDEGAMGLIINFPASNINFPDLLERLNIVPRGADEGIAPDIFERQVHTGGPVETGRGFVLHTPDYYVNNSTLRIDTNVSLTASIDILKAIAAGQGPDRAILALGYAGWSPGQIENEMGANGWLNCPADPDLLFDDDLETKYVRALAKMGINPSHLVNAAGTA